MTSLFEKYLLAVFRQSPEDRIKGVAKLLKCLPEANRRNLAYLIRFLQHMLNFEEQTKHAFSIFIVFLGNVFFLLDFIILFFRMDIKNLVIIFGPNLMNTRGSESENMLGAKVVETLLGYADALFENGL